MRKTLQTATEKRFRTQNLRWLARLTFGFVLAGCLQASAAGFTQDRVSLNVRSAQLKKVLSEIQKQSAYRFLYNQALVDNKRVDINVTDAEVTEVLDKVLDGQGIGYRILDNKLVVLKSAVDGAKVEVADIRITGRVTGAAGEPLTGVSVTAKGTSIGTQTDGQGAFVLSVPDATTTLVFSSVGFTTQEVAIGGRTTVNVSLDAAANALSEVVVIGYGTASRRDLTGSIVKIAGKEVADKPNTNPVASLQGKVTGLSVVNSGTPGQEPDIRIRGTASIGLVKPLYVVDGVFNDNIAYINPNDIESIEVLKDPSSLAIFGVRGASGVIAITTKKARAGQLTINFNTNVGARRLVNKIDMVNAAEFRELFQEQEVNDAVPNNLRFDFSKWTADTDWIDAMTRTGVFTQNNVSVAGGSEKNRFYLGLGYQKEQGVVKHEELNKYTLSFNDELRFTNNIKVGFNFNGLYQKLPFSQANGLLYDARRVLPITAPYNDRLGAYTELAIQAAQLSNPLMNLENKWDKEMRNESRLVGNLYADITIAKKLNLRSTIYLDASRVDERTYNPIIYTYNPTLGDSIYVDRNNRTTSVSQNEQNYRKWQQDHILTYKDNFGQHSLTVTGGFTTYSTSYRGLFASSAQSTTGNPIPDDPRFWYVSNDFEDATTRRSSSSQTERFTVSGLFRGLYSFNNKYYLNASYRRDVASIFEIANRGRNFYSVGAAWELTREDFMSSLRNTVNFLKLKASWGILGSQNTAGYDYPIYPLLISSNTAVFGNVLAPAYTLQYEPDRNLTWESIDAKEVGIEADLLQNRLHTELTYYHRETRDILAEISDGTRRQLSNVGNVVNKGFEGLVSWRQSLNRNFSFNVSANITTFSNKLVSFPAGGKIPASEERPNQTEEGYPIGYFYGYVVEGVYQSFAEKLASPTVVGYNYGPGDLKYKDINGDGLIDTKDRTMIGNPTPDFIYGASVGFNYRNLEFSADFNGSYGNEVYRFWGSSELPFTQFNFGQFRTGRWRGEGTSNWEPALGTTRTINRLPSTYGIEDGSYIRLRNIQIAYTLKPAVLRGVIKNMRVFVNAQNMKTWKRNSGYTPEYGGSATSFGIDNGNGPIPAVYTAGVNLTF